MSVAVRPLSLYAFIALTGKAPTFMFAAVPLLHFKVKLRTSHELHNILAFKLLCAVRLTVRFSRIYCVPSHILSLLRKKFAI
jgi:hypothetical protein